MGLGAQSTWRTGKAVRKGALQLAALAGFSCWVFTPHGLSAQPAPPSPAQSVSLEQEYDAAFQEMVRKPADLDVLFRFATAASKTGDFEGAISALERMLLVNPNLPRVRLELGVLYFRLGSYQVAQTYLEGVLKSETLPPDVRSKAEQFLAEIKGKQNPSRFAGEVFLGTRYQSNANLGPATSSVRLFGQTANLNQAALGTADWGAVSSAQIRHSYDFGLQDNSALESQLTLYGNRQFTLQQANVSLIDFSTGPRFQAFQGTFEELILKPFVAAGYIWVNDQPYYGSYGAGLESAILLADGLRNITIVSARQLNYPDSTFLPTNSQFTGMQFNVVTTFQYELNPLVAIYGFGNLQRYQTWQTVSQSYLLAGVGGGLAFRFVDPLFRSTLPWSINLTVNRQWWSYDAADQIVDPTTVRQQDDTILNIVLSIPFDDRTTFSLSGGRFNRASNLPNYEFSNNNVMFGIGWRF